MWTIKSKICSPSKAKEGNKMWFAITFSDVKLWLFFVFLLDNNFFVSSWKRVLWLCIFTILILILSNPNKKNKRKILNRTQWKWVPWSLDCCLLLHRMLLKCEGQMECSTTCFRFLTNLLVYFNIKGCVCVCERES